MDVFETTVRVLTLAMDGTSHSRIMALVNARQDEIGWLLQILVDRKLLEFSPSLYWTTVDGVKLLEIFLHMERILKADRSLV